MVQKVTSTTSNNQIKAILEHQKIDDVNLCDFVTSGTMKFFDILNLPKGFICVPPCDWNNQESYLICNYLHSELPQHFDKR